MGIKENIEFTRKWISLFCMYLYEVISFLAMELMNIKIDRFTLGRSANSKAESHSLYLYSRFRSNVKRISYVLFNFRIATSTGVFYRFPVECKRKGGEFELLEICLVLQCSCTVSRLHFVTQIFLRFPRKLGSRRISCNEFPDLHACCSVIFCGEK